MSRLANRTMAWKALSPRSNNMQGDIELMYVEENSTEPPIFLAVATFATPVKQVTEKS